MKDFGSVWILFEIKLVYPICGVKVVPLGKRGRY